MAGLIFDLILLTLATTRVTRFVTTDSLGEWLIRDPAEAWWLKKGGSWRAKLISGLECPYCVGFWLGVIAIAVLMLAGGPGDAALWWRLASGAFALNTVVGVLGGKLGV